MHRVGEAREGGLGLEELCSFRFRVCTFALPWPSPVIEFMSDVLALDSCRASL
jgi:hypothetical protein